jgi:hypothetical protein
MLAANLSKEFDLARLHFWRLAVVNTNSNTTLFMVNQEIIMSSAVGSSTSTSYTPPPAPQAQPKPPVKDSDGDNDNSKVTAAPPPPKPAPSATVGTQIDTTA